MENHMGPYEQKVTGKISTDNREVSQVPWTQSDSVRWAIRAMRYYLIIASVILFFYWDGSFELGPTYLLVGLLNWPVLDILGWLVEKFQIPLSLDHEHDKFLILTVIISTGMFYWGTIGFLAEKINRWRML